MTQDEKYTEEFQKALNDYIKLRFNQDECNGFMHGFHKGAEAKQLILSSVSNQREQFFALLKYAMPTNYKDLALERIVERFINESK
mgnify:CR=1 FL=1|tara:strand:- start:96 stop:353 length:258 start_codon:yes stop_codon:yes gene_type:complete